MKKKQIIGILLIVLIIFFLITNLIYAQNYKDFNFNKWVQNEQNAKLYNYFTSRAEQSNSWYIDFQRNLDDKDKLTPKQRDNRVKWIFKYAYKLNYMAPKYHPRRIAKDYFWILEHEANFVNYWNTDDGQSFGVTQVTWRVTQAASDKFGDNFNIYKNKNTTGNLQYDPKLRKYYNPNHRTYLRQNPEFQIKYGLWYAYKLMSKYYPEDRLTAWTGYNVGPGLNKWQAKVTFKQYGKIVTKYKSFRKKESAKNWAENIKKNYKNAIIIIGEAPRFRNYYFIIRGKITYGEEQMQKIK